MQVIVNYRSALEGFSETVCVLSEMMAPHISRRRTLGIIFMPWDGTKQPTAYLQYYFTHL